MLFASTAAAVVAVSCTFALTGCTADPSPGAAGQSSESSESSVPLPSPTGTWESPSPDATEGPRTAAPLPTETAAADETVEFGTGVAVAISGITSTTVTAKTPGEVSGPAVIVTVTVKNDSTQAVNLDSAVVNLSATDGEYGVGTTAGNPQPLRGDVAPGASTKGTYVFMLDPAAGRGVTVSVNYGAGEPVAVFTGKTS